MSIELLKSISTQKTHKTYNKQGLILHYLGTNQEFTTTSNKISIVTKIISIVTNET